MVLAAPVALDDPFYSVNEDSVMNVPAITGVQPIHRYSFDGTGGNGAVLIDSIGGAHGTLAEADGVSRLENGQIILGGGSSATAGFGNLPNGIVSSLTDVTFEGWVTVTAVQNWQRYFSFGSSTGGEFNSPGGAGAGHDVFMYAANRGTAANTQRVEVKDADPLPDGSAGNFQQPVDMNEVTTLGQEHYFAVVYDADGNAGAPQIRIYREVGGAPQLSGTLNTSLLLSDLNDINNWLGRSQWNGDANLRGSYNEFRVYDQPLSVADINANFAAGPDVPQPILLNDSDADGDPLTVVAAGAVNAPVGGPFDITTASGAAVTVNADGSYTYDPRGSATLQALENGDTLTDSFTYTISDSQGGTDTATVQVRVRGITTDPVANDDVGATAANQVLTMVDDGSSGLTGNLLDNDVDEDGMVVVSGFTPLSQKGALVTVNVDGTFSYDPTGVQEFINLPVGQTAVDTFSYSIDDGSVVAPIHRYSFDGTGGDGAVLVDSVGGANGTLETVDGISRLENGQMILGGSSSVTSGFGNLPNNLLAGLSDVTFEGWVTVDSILNWQRFFSFGSNTNGEQNAPGGAGGGHDVFMYAANRGTTAHTQQVAFRDADPAPDGSASGTQQSVDMGVATTLGQELYFAVVYDADGNAGTPQVRIYRDVAGVPTLSGTLNTSVQLSDLNDINNWLGRSQWNGDNNLDGSYNEFRIYDRPLSPQQIATNFTNGPNAAFDNHATVTITVTGVNEAPVAQDDPGYLTNENTPLVIPAAGSTPQLMLPIHRYSFDGSGSNGAVLVDSLGGAHGTLATADGISRLENGQMILNGGSSATAGFGNLPNGLLTGLTDVTFEGWVTVDSVLNWQRFFSFGSNTNGEQNTPGGAGGGHDVFMYAANRGTTANTQRVELKDSDPFPDGSASNTQQNVDMSVATTLGQELYFAVAYDADGNNGTPQIRIYRDVAGVPTLSGTLNTSIQLSDLNDINNWLGRSQWNGDNNLDGSYNEFRIYDRPLSPAEVLNSYTAGPNVIRPILLNDSDVDTGTTLSVSAVQGVTTPLGGPLVATTARGATVTVQSNGQLTYDPTASMEIQALLNGQTLNDSFTYTISDGQGGSDTATVSLLITGSTEVEDDFYATDQNSPLVANDATGQATVGNFNDDGVMANDSRPGYQVVELNGNPGSIGAATALPSGANMTLNADGTFIYDPNGVYDALPQGQTDTDSFTYTIQQQILPIHRYSFDGTGGDGAVLVDSIGGANGTLEQADGVSRLENGQMILGGGSQNTAGFGNLPNGLLTGLTDVTFEGWVTVDTVLNWQRYFSFGSNTNGEQNAPGGAGGGHDVFMYAANRGTAANTQRVELRDADPLPDGSASNTQQPVDMGVVTTLGQEHYFAVTYDADGNAGSPQIRIYREVAGVPTLSGTLNTSIRLSDLNDINNWLGRSQWNGDANLDGSYNEFRIYDRPLSATEINRNYADGPDAIGAFRDTANVTVTIAGLNDQPTANSATATTNEDAGSVSVDLLVPATTSDIDTGDMLVITSVTQDVGASSRDLAGAFTVVNGVVSFAPSLLNDLSLGDTATIVFNYTVDDQQSQPNSTAASTLTVTVEGRNDTPAVASNMANVSVIEGASTSNSGTFTDVDLGDSVTISASVGSITQDPGNSGTWTWSFVATSVDGPSSLPVVITADDGNGGSATSTFTLTITNAPPTASFLSPPTEAALDVPVPFTLVATDPSAIDQAAPFTYTIDWGDGSPVETVMDVSPRVVTHNFQNFGQVTVTLTVTDKDGAVSAPVQTVITIVPVAIVGNDLVATGTETADRIVFFPSNTGVRVRYNNQTYPLDGSSYSFSGQMIANGRGGADHIVVSGRIPNDAVFDGGASNDYLAGGTLNDTLSGGDANDTILGGEGDNVLIGGAGSDRLEGRSGIDLIFGGDGNDRLNGGAGNDTLDGGAGSDFVFGDLGDDLMVGRSGIDTLNGSYGNDIVLGGDDADQVFGGVGNDLLIGGQGSDRVRGDAGDDTVVGGSSAIEAQLETDLDSLIASFGTSGLSPAVQAAVDAWFTAQTGTSRALFEPFGDDSAADDLTGDTGADSFHARGTDLVRDLRVDDISL